MRTGGCLCGKVRYQCAELGPLIYCHCADCRRSTGSAFNVGVRVENSAFEVTGDLAEYTKKGDSGGEVTRHFCRVCGAQVFTSSSRNPAVIFVKAGTFDDPDLPAASHESWTSSKVAWAEIPADIAHYEKNRVAAPPP
jgi:hypothetical protein